MVISEYAMDVASGDMPFTLSLLETALKDISTEPQELKQHITNVRDLVWFAKNNLSIDRESKRTTLEKIMPLCQKALEFVKDYESKNKTDIPYSEAMYEDLFSMQEYAMGRKSIN